MHTLESDDPHDPIGIEWFAVLFVSDLVRHVGDLLGIRETLADIHWQNGGVFAEGNRVADIVPLMESDDEQPPKCR